MQIDNMEQSIILLKNIDEFIMSVEDTEKQLQVDLHNKNGERDDLLHEIELSKLNAIERMQVYAHLEKVLKERRILKDKIEFIHTIKPFAQKFITKGMLAETKLTVENLNNLKSNHETRKYTPRILKNLKCVNNDEKK